MNLDPRRHMKFWLFDSDEDVLVVLLAALGNLEHKQRSLQGQ
jgi:hypothetical protein